MKKVTRKPVIKDSATSSPQIIKELISLGVTHYKTPELEFTVHPGMITQVLPRSTVETKEEEVDHDERAFQVAMGRGIQ